MTVDTWIFLTIIYAVFGFLQGGYFASKMALFMDSTNPQIGATQFSIYASCGNGGMTVGESFSGTFVAIFGFARTFLWSALFFGPALLILYFIKLRK